MKARFLADADFNHNQEIDIGAAIEDLLLICAASTLEEWRDKIGFVPL
jgi:hypothetical protein